MPVPNIPDYQTVGNFEASLLRICTGQLSSFKNFASLIIIGPVIGSPSKHTAVNHLHNILTNCTNLGCFIVCHLRRHLTIHLHVINNCNWSFCFFISQTVDDPMMHEGTTTIWYLPLSRPLTISKSRGTVNETHFFVPVVPCSLTSRSFEAITIV